MQLGVLGPVVATDDEGATVPLGGSRERLLLAHLLMRSGHFVATETLIDLLWTDPPPTARQQVQNTVSRLRQRMTAHDCGLIATLEGGYVLRLGQHALDLTTFRSGVALGRDPGVDLQRRSDAVDAALRLWRGSPLDGAIAPHVGDGTHAAITALGDERTAARSLQLDLWAQLGRHDQILTIVGSLLENDPWNEHFHEHRLRALACTGRRTEAAAAYLRLRRQFVDELGVPPGPSLVRLNTRILDDEPVDHDALGAPGRIVPRELPAQSGTFVGRVAINAQVIQTLTGDRRGGAPTVALLTGVGGVGKTALALHTAHRLAGQFPDGTLYAALADDPSGEADPHEVIGRFLRALGVEAASVPTDHDDRVALYRSTVAGRRVLVVMDGARTESQVRPLLPTSDGSAAIITSRSRLGGLVGVRRLVVPGLDRDEAIELLHLTAAEAIGPDDDRAVLGEVADLCGELPLALCVAGSRLATNAAVDLFDLRDRLAREHARLDELSTGDVDVRASIGLSFADLPEAAQILFRRLADLATSGWPGWIAEVLAPANPGGSPSRALDALTDRHLVEWIGRDALGQPRYRLHSLVAEFAHERLTADEGRAQAQPWRGALLAAWLERAENEPPDTWFEIESRCLVRAVMSADGPHEAEAAARLALILQDFFTARARDDDRERVLRVALAGLDAADSADADLRASLLGALFAVLAQRERHTELPEVAGAALEAATEAADAEAIGRSLSQAGFAALALDHYDDALDWYRRAADFARAHDDESRRLRAEASLGVVLRNLGRAEEGDPFLAAMIDESRRTGQKRSTGIWLATRAEGLVDLARYPEAREYLVEALGIADDLGDGLGAAYCQLGLARVCIGTGEHEQAQELLDRAAAELEPRAAPDADLDVLRCHVDLLAAQANWLDALEVVERLVDDRRLGGPSVDLAADLARRAAITGRLADSKVDEGDDSLLRDYEAEVSTVLSNLGVSYRALRLPEATYHPEEQQ